MKRQFQKGDPDVFNLAWLDDEELSQLQEVMQPNRENHICGYWLHCLNEQLAIRAGKLRIIPGAESRDPDFSQYPLSDLHAAQLIFRAMGNDFNAIGKSTGERLCEMLVRCCENELLERKKKAARYNDEFII